MKTKFFLHESPKRLNTVTKDTVKTRTSYTFSDNQIKGKVKRHRNSTKIMTYLLWQKKPTSNKPMNFKLQSVPNRMTMKNNIIHQLIFWLTIIYKLLKCPGRFAAWFLFRFLAGDVCLRFPFLCYLHPSFRIRKIICTVTIAKDFIQQISCKEHSFPDVYNENFYPWFIPKS